MKYYADRRHWRKYCSGFYLYKSQNTWIDNNSATYQSLNWFIMSRGMVFHPKTAHAWYFSASNCSGEPNQAIRCQRWTLSHSYSQNVSVNVISPVLRTWTSLWVYWLTSISKLKKLASGWRVGRPSSEECLLLSTEGPGLLTSTHAQWLVTTFNTGARHLTSSSGLTRHLCSPMRMPAHKHIHIHLTKPEFKF